MSDSQKWFWLALATISVSLIYLLAPVLTPFLLGAILAYIGDPVADRLEAAGLSRTWSVVSVFSALTLVALLILIILIPMLERQFSLLASNLPSYIDWLQNEGLPSLGALLGVDMEHLNLADIKAQVRKSLSGTEGVFTDLLGTVSRSGMTLLAWLANLALIPVVAFYMLRDWDVMTGHIRELIPRRIEHEVVKLAQQSDEVLSAFLRGQLTVMMALGTTYSVGLWLVGLDLALLIGMLAGLVSFVPYLGTIIGIVVAGIAAIIQFHELLPLLYVAVVFGIGQMLEGMVLTPLLVGDKIGLHPVAVIFAVLAGGQLFGFFGVLLALPVAAVVMVLLRYLRMQYHRSDIYGEEDVASDGG